MTMGKAFLNAYSLLLIKTCHRRGAFAMGGMAAQIPVKGDKAANEAAFAKVRADKEREAGNGHDGTWVAHPDLVPIAMEVFDRMMPEKNQLVEEARRRPRDANGPARGSQGQAHGGGPAREHPGRRAIYRGVAQGPRRGADLQPDGGRGDRRDLARPGLAMAPPQGEARRRPRGDAGDVPRRARPGEMERVKGEVGAKAFDGGRFKEAIELFSDMSLSDTFDEFLTLPAYKLID